MRRQTFVASCVAIVSLLTLGARAETVVPMKGQSPEQIQGDVAQCQTVAKSSYDQALASANATAAPASTAPSSGGRVKGAVAGAAAGAAAAEVRGNRYEHYDDIDSDVKEEYRQNQARDAAAAGAVIGGAKQRQSRRQQQQQAAQQQQQQSAAATQSADAASKQAYVTCMSGLGYSVTP